MKPTQITAEQYLQYQLDKHIVTDPSEDIDQLEKQTHINHTYTMSEPLKTLIMELKKITQYMIA